MTRLPVPLATLDRRIPEAGRIRLGVKTDKGMKSIDTFRFTSPNESIINDLAALYGGTVKRWHEIKASPPDQFEVITTVKEIDVYLPVNALSVWYEMWSGGGVTRRCDGLQCQIPIVTPGGWEMNETDCICLAKAQMECRPYTRLNVILPQLPFHGVWRLETKGWNAVKELPGMVDTIEMMSQQGRMVEARLYVERRVQQTAAGKRNFVVPGILIAHTAQNMIAGAAEPGRHVLVQGTAPVAGELGTGIPVPVSELPADIVDAELVNPELDFLGDRIYEIAQQQHLDGERLWRGVMRQVGIIGMEPANDDQLERIRSCIARLESGALTVSGFNPDGSVIWRTTT